MSDTMVMTLLIGVAVALLAFVWLTRNAGPEDKIRAAKRARRNSAHRHLLARRSTGRTRSSDVGDGDAT